MSFISVSSLSEKLASQFETLRKMEWADEETEAVKEAQYQVKGSDESVAVKVRMVHCRVIVEDSSECCELPDPWFKGLVTLSKENQEVRKAVEQYFKQAKYSYYEDSTPERAFEDHHITILIMKS